MIGYTDYPIIELGDDPAKEAPIRECEVLDRVGDYYHVLVNRPADGCTLAARVPTWCMYSEPGRGGEVPALDDRNVYSPDVKL